MSKQKTIGMMAIIGLSTVVAHAQGTVKVGGDIRVREEYIDAEGKDVCEIGQQEDEIACVTKGWLRASHRAIDEKLSLENAPWYTHKDPQPLVPGKVYLFRIAVMPTAHRFAKGSRIRIELANGDSSVTEFVFAHEYPPAKIGVDTLYHDRKRPSRVLLPIRAASTPAPSARSTSE